MWSKSMARVLYSTATSAEFLHTNTVLIECNRRHRDCCQLGLVLNFQEQYLGNLAAPCRSQLRLFFDGMSLTQIVPLSSSMEDKEKS